VLVPEQGLVFRKCHVLPQERRKEAALEYHVDRRLASEYGAKVGRGALREADVQDLWMPSRFRGVIMTVHGSAASIACEAR
jgi:hypothetical protein